MLHSFLLIGQSNAAGRGLLEEAKPLDTRARRLRVLRNGRWQEMFRPVNPDRVFSGSCLAESFAREYSVAHPDVQVGIIPCADGGTKIEQWLPGEVLFDNAVNQARLAMRTSTLKGILWHQGEGDCLPEYIELYFDRFRTVMDTLRAELGMPELPVIVGGLGDFLVGYDKKPTIGIYYPEMNAVLRRIGEEYPHCAFVSAEGLTANLDNLHFSADALEKFGVRYYKAYEPFYRDGATEPTATQGELSELELL